MAEDRVEHLPPVTLLRGGTRFSACGTSLRTNAYCPESNEISLSTTGMQRTQRFSETSEWRSTHAWATRAGRVMIRAIDDRTMSGKLLVIGMLTSLLGVAIYESVLVRGLSPVS